MNGDVLDNSVSSLLTSESSEKSQQSFNYSSTNNNSNNNDNGLTSVLHGFIVNGLALTAMMKTEMGENGEGEQQQQNNSLEDINEEINDEMKLKKTIQSTSSFKPQNNLNFNNSWRCAQQMEENDISSHFERKKFLNANFGFFEENGKELKKNCEEINFGRVDSLKLQEEDDNLQNFNLEKFNKTNNFSLFSTKMLMTTMNDFGNKDGFEDQMSHSSYKNNFMSIGVNEDENNLKNEINRTPTTNIMPATNIMPTTNMPKKKKKKPYKELTLEQKVELIRLAERCTNLSQASIAERYAIAKSNVCRILQRKTEYVRALECAGFAGSRKRKLRTAINLGEENLELINGEMKNNKNIGGGRGGRNNLFVDVEEEEELNNNNNCFNILCDKKDIDKLIEGSWKNGEIEANLDLNGNEEEDDKWFLS
ncbi:unnamed protein product [Meloidogyne enterolobii]|uniref:Uncharacterized protein n=1 Tax=Meloidogyne enterolobii TaxID=390850 RepID=A0ACB1APZ5_MELEN